MSPGAANPPGPPGGGPPTPPPAGTGLRTVVELTINSVDLGALTTYATVAFDDGSTQQIQWPITLTVPVPAPWREPPLPQGPNPPPQPPGPPPGT